MRVPLQVSRMNFDEEIVEARTKTRLLELRLDALMNLLSKEGILTHREVQEEADRLLSENNPGQ